MHSKDIRHEHLTKACQLKSAALGKWWEHEIELVFRDMEELYKFHSVRLYDTTTAGAFMPSTDGDYICMSNGSGILVEAKCSAKHSTLIAGASSLIPKKQVLAHRLWARAKGRSLFLFASVGANRFEVWGGLYVAGCRVSGEKLVEAQGLLYSSPLTDGEFWRNMRGAFTC